ncbi:hypothetical protein [Jiangella alkaliphila]|nr:hypothetical protein [Jiangella alkaliphila]
MSNNHEFDPFAGIEDEQDAGPDGARAGLLEAARRGYVPLRKAFVQRPQDSAPVAGRPSARASVLYDLVHRRNQRALDVFLLMHALQPILDGTPLLLGTWANILSVKSRVDATAVSRAIETLEDLHLVVREDDSRTPTLRLLLEDGSGKPWHKPGSTVEEGPGYFVIPHDYWTRGLSERLSLPGKAMLLILLSETQNPKTPAFAMAVERASEWYGISERTAERGYQEIGKAGFMKVKVQKVNDDRHPVGRRDVYWRALKSPFDTMTRQRLQGSATKAARAAGSAAAATSVAVQLQPTT